jgi:membrane protein
MGPIDPRLRGGDDYKTCMIISQIAHACYTARMSLFRIIQASGKAFFKHDLLDRAASLSYMTLLGLLPLLFLNVIILSVLPFFKTLNESFQAFLFKNLIAVHSEALERYLKEVLHHSHQLSWFNIVFLIVAVTGTLFNIQSTFQQIWGVKKHFSLKRSLNQHLGLIVVFPMLCGLSIVLSSYFFSLRFLGSVTELHYVQKLMFKLLPFGLILVALTLLYRSLPPVKPSWKSAWLSAIFASILFQLAKLFFLQYMNFGSGYISLMGALSVIPFLLIWIYFLCLVVLWGGTFCYTLEQLKH